MQDGQTHTRKSTGYCVHCTIKQMTVSSNLHMWTSTFLFFNIKIYTFKAEVSVEKHRTF